MTCEKAEEFLSAYLDDILAPQLRTEVATHVESCDQCRETLEDYRRFDLLVANERRAEPPAELRGRIFDSPEFAAILAEQNDEDEQVSALRRLAGAPPGWARGALSAAAVAVLVFGSALLIKQGLLHSGTPSARTTQLVAGPQGAQPLAHGARVVYLRDGALWSAPEAGPGLADRLTPHNVRVGAWVVSPDGTQVAYVDAASGRIHVVRSDDQNDVATESVSVTGAGAALVWSPDGQRLAYLANVPGEAPALHLVNANGANDRAVSTPAGAQLSVPVWSPDGLNLAFTADAGGANGVYFYNIVTRGDARLLAVTDAADPSAAVAPGSIHWLSDMAYPTLTWAATDDGGVSVTGVFAQSVLDGSSPRRLTPQGIVYAAADFTSGRGAWLVSSTGVSPTLALISAQGDGAKTVETGVAYAHIAWSPRGDMAALVGADGHVALWSAPGGVAPVRGAGGASAAPVWSTDGGRVAVPAPGSVVVVSVESGVTAATNTFTAGGAPTSAAFAPDGKGLAVSLPSSVAIFADGAAAPKLLPGADQGPLVWSIAG